MQQENKKLVIGYWPIRGLVQQILSILRYTDQDYEFVAPKTSDEWNPIKQ